MPRSSRLAALLTICGIVLIGVVLARQVVRVSTVLVPAEGGTYTEGVVGAPQWPNPVLAAFNETDEDLARLLFRGLTRVDERSHIVPDLAESWEVSGDALVYTFTLKAGLKWQDGAPITADDAVYTFQLMQSPDFPGPPYLVELWKTVQVAKVDDLRVQFTLNEPFAPFLDYTTIGLLPYHVLRDTSAADLLTHPFNSSPVGNGPFMLERATSEEVVLRPNPLSGAPKPYLERLALRLYPDTDAVFAAYSRGEVDGIRAIPADRLEEAAGLPSLNLYSAPVAEAVWVLFNTQSPPLDETAVRRALALATDRPRLIAEALRGQALPLYGPLLPTSWAYNPAVEEAAHNPEQARALLADAGWADTDGDGVRDKEGRALRVEIACLNTPQDVRVAQALATQWQEIGARVAVTPLAAGELANGYLRPRAFQAVLYHWLDITPDPDMYPFWHSTQATDPGQNFAQFKNRDADEIMEQARRTPDTVLRQELYAHLQEILRDEAPAVFLYQPVYTMGVRDTVQNVTLGPVHSASDRFQSIAGWYMETRRVVASQAR